LRGKFDSKVNELAMIPGGSLRAVLTVKYSLFVLVGNFVCNPVDDIVTPCGVLVEAQVKTATKSSTPRKASMPDGL
jgi:hypothetical protein